MNKKHDIIAASFVGVILTIIILLMILVVARMIHNFTLHDFLILVSLLINGGLMSFFFISLINDIKNYPFYLRKEND